MDVGAALNVASRHECAHTRTLPYVHHTGGTGKPKRKKCEGCGGQLRVMFGTWEVFKWRGDGNYHRRDSLAAYNNERDATEHAELLGADTHCVRWIAAID